MEFNLVHIQNLNIASCIMADYKGWGWGGRPYWLIFFQKATFFRVKGIYFVVRICNK